MHKNKELQRVQRFNLDWNCCISIEKVKRVQFKLTPLNCSFYWLFELFPAKPASQLLLKKI